MPSEIALRYSKYALQQEKFYYSWITSKRLYLTRVTWFTGSPVVCNMALEFLIELEFRNVDFCGGRKPENPEKNPRSKNKNQQQTQPTYDTGSRIRTRATLVGGERNHHYAIPCSVKFYINFTPTCYWVDWTMNVTYLFQRLKSVAFYTCSHLCGDQMSESSVKERVENVLWSMLKTKISHTSFITQFLFPTTLNNFRRFCVIIYM